MATASPESKGKAKIELPRRDKPMLQCVLESVLASAVHEVICVVDDLLSARLHIPIADDRLSWLVDVRLGQRQSSVIIAGLWAVDSRCSGVLFVPGDGPTVQSALIDALIARAGEVTAPIIAPACNGRIREPALFRREVFPELLKLKADQGANALVRKRRAEVDLLAWNATMKPERVAKREQQRIKLPA
jgi:CTP:molybdopterin cytidylyltransferase MocA